MEPFFLPVLSHFRNGNAWTGSGGRLRYKLAPEEEQIAAQVWEGPLCLELSRVEESRAFPMTEEGMDELRSWLDGWGDAVNSRPTRTLAGVLEMRAAAQNSEGEG